jgi:signal recognition particle receptor subunit beta
LPDLIIIAGPNGAGKEAGMNQKSEIERMQAAFKRAAEKATRDTREERSGRFEVRDDARRHANSQAVTRKQQEVIGWLARNVGEGISA